MMLSRIVAARVVGAGYVLLAISLILFVAVETLPGDFASATAPRFTTGDQIEFTRERMGLNVAPAERYFAWIGRAIRGEFGESWYTRQEIAPMLAERIGNTALLAAFAAAMAIPVGFAAAVVSVMYRRSLFDRGSSIISLTVISMPEFLVAYLLMTFFVVTYPIFPAHTVFYDEMRINERLHAMVLPAASLAIVAVAPVLRLTRASLINILAADYIEMANLKGIRLSRVVLVHALPNALPPIMNALVIIVANFIVGAFIVEQIFSYPGIGKSMIAAVKFRDIPLVLAIGLVFAAFFVFLNLFADIVSILATPRARFPVQSIKRLGWPSWQTINLRRVPLKQLCVSGVLVATAALIWWAVPKSETYTIAKSLDPPGTVRDALLIDDLQNIPANGVQPAHFGYFLPVGPKQPAMSLSGKIMVSTFTAERRYAFDYSRPIPDFRFPGFQFEFFNSGSDAIPMERDMYLPTTDDRWQIILSVGRVWSEPKDGGWSRLSLPFTLVRTGSTRVLNGVLNFAYHEAAVTQMRIQIAQEGTPNSPKTDIWGQAEIDFFPGPIAQRDRALAALSDERTTDFPVASWKMLEDLVGQGRLRGFDNEYIRSHVSLSGLTIDGTIYLRSCQTRLGPYPFCAQLRHPVASVSKSLGGAVAMLRLAEKYGTDVFDLRILEFVPLRAKHDGWRDVTFRHALGMSTGIGNLTPRPVEEYIETDFAPMEMQIWNARDIEAKLRLISDYRDYPWPPGTVLRYKSSETMLLAIAMDRLIRSREGADYGLWEMMVAEIYTPLGIGPIPTRKMYDGPGRAGVPQYGGGMNPNIQEVLKLARLITQKGMHRGVQILHREMTEAALSPEMDRGLPSWYRYGDGGMATYDMSFWLAPFQSDKGCSVRVPQMVGYGGNYVSLMPNGIIGFRFADGRENVEATYDSSGIRRISDQIRPFCY